MDAHRAKKKYGVGSPYENEKEAEALGSRAAQALPPGAARRQNVGGIFKILLTLNIRKKVVNVARFRLCRQLFLQATKCSFCGICFDTHKAI